MLARLHAGKLEVTAPNHRRVVDPRIAQGRYNAPGVEVAVADSNANHLPHEAARADLNSPAS